MDDITKQILTTVADGYDSVRPGAGDCVRERIGRESTMTVHDLSLIRMAIMTVIDDGWKCGDGCDLHHKWSFNSKDVHQDINDQAYDDKQRLRFCDAVQQYIVDRTTPKGNVD